jgi:hypothetical protein
VSSSVSTASALGPVWARIEDRNTNRFTPARSAARPSAIVASVLMAR